MGRTCIYFRPLDPDRWLPGDRYVRSFIRRILRGKPRVGGVERVVRNLCEGLKRIGVDYVVNPPFEALGPDDRVAAFGIGRTVLDGYDRPNPIVAGIALMSGPSQWPTLFEDHPVATYLQHSEWAADLYRPYFGERCGVWAAGVDTQFWRPASGAKTWDLVVYVKTAEVDPEMADALVARVCDDLERAGQTFTIIRYGAYRPDDYLSALRRARGMVFISPRESQGLASAECLACDVPILAWDPGILIDRPHGFAPTVASSVPYFDDRCGVRFKSKEDFADALAGFVVRRDRGDFAPREYVLEHLSLERCATHFCEILDAANPSDR